MLAVIVAGILAAFVWSRFGKGRLEIPVIRTVPDFQLTNQFGKPFGLSDLKGRVWVADVFFTRCPGPCAKMTRNLRELQKRLPANLPVSIVSLTADPEYDTPKVLLEYAAKFEARSDNWQFLTGPKAQLYDLAMNGLLLAVAENEPGQSVRLEDLFIHSSRFVLVDRQGRVRAFDFDGTEPETVTKLLERIDALLKEK